MSDVGDVRRVLSRWRERFTGNSIGGYSAADIEAHSASLAKPLPAPIKALYQEVTPEAWDILTKGQGEPGLLPLENLGWNNSLSYDEGGIVDNIGPGEPSWMVFGSFAFGDVLVWSELSIPPGAILFIFHEGERPLILGTSLAEWLERLMNCGGMEYADNLDDLKESALPLEVQAQFLDQHARLNPPASDF